MQALPVDSGIVNRGVFLTFEGLDGSGKSTQLRLLAGELHRRGYSVVTTRNPGGTPVGDRIRSLVLDSRTDSQMGGMAPETEMALMFADRAQSLHEVVRPALRAGAIVLCDRFTDSSEAYQGAGRGLGPERILAMHQAVCGGQQPDATLLLLPPLEDSLHRARRRNQRHMETRGTDENRFEQEDNEFYRRIYAQYEVIAAREPQRVLTFRENSSVERIAAQILHAVLGRLPSVRSAQTEPQG